MASDAWDSRPAFSEMKAGAALEVAAFDSSSGAEGFVGSHEKRVAELESTSRSRLGGSVFVKALTENHRFIGTICDGLLWGAGLSQVNTQELGKEYVGEFEEGEPHGVGVLRCSDGTMYMGEWEKGAKQGRGIEVYPDGSGYEGEFLSDQWHGLGKFTFAGGQTHTGEFKLGYSDGVVAVTDADEGIEEMWVKYQQGHRLGSSSALFSWRERKFRRDLKTSVVKVLECAQHAAQRGKELAESLHALVEFASLIPRDFEGEATPDAVCEHSMQRESSCALARDIRARVAARSSRLYVEDKEAREAQRREKAAAAEQRRVLAAEAVDAAARRYEEESRAMQIVQEAEAMRADEEAAARRQAEEEREEAARQKAEEEQARAEAAARRIEAEARREQELKSERQEKEAAAARARDGQQRRALAAKLRQEAVQVLDAELLESAEAERARAAQAELVAHEGALGAAALRVALRRVRERLYLGMFLARALPPPHVRGAGWGAAAAGGQPSPRAGALAGRAPAPPSPAAPHSPRDANLAGPAGPSIEPEG